MNQVDQPQQYEITATSNEVDEFMQSAVYRDFMAIAHARIDVIHNDLADVSVTDSIETVRRLQGEMLGIKFWILFPETFRDSQREKEEIEIGTETKGNGT